MEDVPIGFLMALAENMPAMHSFANMPRAQREQIIERASHVSSREEMQSVIRSLL